MRQWNGGMMTPFGLVEVVRKATGTPALCHRINGGRRMLVGRPCGVRARAVWRGHRVIWREQGERGSWLRWPSKRYQNPSRVRKAFAQKSDVLQFKASKEGIYAVEGVKADIKNWFHRGICQTCKYVKGNGNLISHCQKKKRSYKYWKEKRKKNELCGARLELVVLHLY